MVGIILEELSEPASFLCYFYMECSGVALSVVCRKILMPVGKSDGRRRRIDPERLTHSYYCILQIITFYFRFLQETE